MSTTLQVDNAADISILPMKCVSRLKIKIYPTQIKAKTANGSYLKLVGQATVPFSFNGKEVEHVIYVTEGKLHLLGADLMEKLGLFQVPLDQICSKESVCPCQPNFQKVLSHQVCPQEGRDEEAFLL